MASKNIRVLIFLAIMIPVFSSCGIFAQDRGLIAEAKIEEDTEFLFRKEVTDFAQTFTGTKYRYAGKTPTGFDCSGFVFHVMKEYQLEMAASSSTQELQGVRISSEDAQPGDLLFFRRSKKGRVFHVAMVLSNSDGNLSMVHSTTNRGVVIDNLKESSYWRTKVITARDIISQ